MDEGLEVYFFPVGTGSKTGDAIVVRYGILDGQRSEQKVIVVDGGYEDSGNAIVNHIRTVFGTSEVDLVISTHPDQDHVNGLKVVLEELSVGLLVMHLPWERSAVVAEAKQMSFKSPKVDDKFEANFAAASELADIARSKQIQIVEPFAGMTTPDGKVTILSPTVEFFTELMAQIADSEKTVTASALSKLLSHLSEAAQKLVPETIHIESLTDAGETSPQNNSSVITLIQVAGHNVLLTADAGMPALDIAATRLEAMGLIPGGLHFVQVPHHGSRRNVGPSVLDRLLGTKGYEGFRGLAFVSGARDSTKHPAKKVLNAFRRRGYHVHGTDDGKARRHGHNSPTPAGWSASIAHPFHGHVEEDEG